MKRSKAEQKLRKHLEGLHTILWQGWDITKEEEMDDAVATTLDMLEQAGIIRANELPS